MKKLSLKKLNFGSAELLGRDELKFILGGYHEGSEGCATPRSCFYHGDCANPFCNVCTNGGGSGPKHCQTGEN